MSKPFIKWVGGKSRLLPEIQKHMPKNIVNYYEPFVGGGAVLFSLAKLTSYKTATINDYNEELINTYQVIKDKPYELIKYLNAFKKSEEFFYEIRQWDRADNYNNLSAEMRAARFIYLNKMGFNGLYRVNSKGQCNVPYGKKNDTKLYEEENILSCSKILKNVNILHGSYEKILPFLNENSFVYFDPPYIPLTETSNFTRYTNKGFDFQEQVKLKEFCNRISDMGVKFMLSNSASLLAYDLYQNYNIKEVNIFRGIAGRGKCRKKLKEIIVTNYVN